MPSQDFETRRRPTLADVARRAGVSSALASLALRGVAGPSEQARDRVLRAAAELRYRSNATASLLARRRSKLVGITCYLDRGFDADVVDRLYVEAQRRGFDVLLSAITPSRSARESITTLVDHRCEAIVCVGVGPEEADLAHLSERVPMVIVGAAAAASQLGVVRTAGDEGVRLAVEHLVGLGHEDIAHIDGGRGASAEERRRGYDSAMRAAGLQRFVRVVAGGPSEAYGADAGARLLDEHRPSAIVAYNDASAVGVLAEARRRSIGVPTELSVVGYDGSRLAALSYIDLTTVAQNVESLAAEAMTLASSDVRDDGASGREVVLAPILIVRSSTAPPQAPDLLAPKRR